MGEDAGVTVDRRRSTMVNGLIGDPMDKRVKFDFEIDFSNGGGLQGQEFRLDIPGDDISDEELAEYIVKDMRLLMVKEVRILKKEIITEEHKRQPGTDPD
jgi:hypothetical protein